MRKGTGKRNTAIFMAASLVLCSAQPIAAAGANNAANIAENTYNVVLYSDSRAVKSVIHNFTVSGKDSDFFSITGNLATNKGTATYDGMTLTQCLKMESSTNISFDTTQAGELVLVFASTETGKKVKVDGTAYTTDSDGIVRLSIESGSHTIAKSGSINLFYIEFTYEE